MILTVILDASIEKYFVISDLKLGKENEATKCTYNIEGQGIFSSKASSVIGEEVIATGFLGGYTGDLITKELERWRVKTDFIEVSTDNHINISIINSASEEVTKISEPGGFITATNQEELLIKYLGLVERCNVVVISGNVPKGGDGSLIEYMIQIAKEKNKKVILNMNGILLKSIINSKPTIITVDFNSLSYLIGQNINDTKAAIEAAKKVCISYIDTVVIQDWNGSFFVVCKEGVYEGISYISKPLNNINPIEAVITGLAAGLSRGYSLVDTIKLAAAVSKSVFYSKNGNFNKKDVEKLFICENVKLIDEMKEYGI